MAIPCSLSGQSNPGMPGPPHALTNLPFASNSTTGGAGGQGGNAGISVFPALAGNGGAAGALSRGGGLFVDTTGIANISNSTIAFNNAIVGARGQPGTPSGGAGPGAQGAAGAASGGGLFNNGGTASPSSSIFSDNAAPAGPDSSGNVNSQGFNLIGNAAGSTGFTSPTDIAGSNPLLGALQNNGGPTFTHALGAGSPAIDKGAANGNLTDQRGAGFPRLRGAATDIGAFESGSAPVANNQSASTTQGTPKAITLTATDAENDPLTFTVLTNPTNGVLSGSGANRTYTPNAGFTGSDSFTFRVNDGSADSNTATVTLTVTAVPSTFVATADPVDVAVGQPVKFTATGGTGVVVWLYGDGSTGSGFNATHAYSAPGTYTILVTLTDPNTGLSVSQILTVRVHANEFRVSRANFKLSNDGDTVTFVGRLHVPAGLEIGGQTIVMSIGGNTQTFTLDAKGRGESGTNLFMLRRSSKNRDQEAPISGRFTGALRAGLAANAPLDANGLPTVIVFLVQFNGGFFSYSVPVNFQDGGARYKLLKVKK